MGGILSGLIGGIAKGSIGGILQEGARKQKQIEDDRSLLTRMHMQRIEDWENLSPEEQDFHVRSVEELHPELKKSGVLRTGINIAQAVTPHFTNMATLEQAPDPLAGVAQQAGLPTVATKRTPAQNKLLQAKLYEQNLAESERKRKMAAISAIPGLTPDEGKRIQASVETGVNIPMPPQETYEDISLDVPGQGTIMAQRGVHSGNYFISDPTAPGGRKSFSPTPGTKFTPREQRGPMNEEGYAQMKAAELGRPLTGPERLAIHKEWMQAGAVPSFQFLPGPTGFIEYKGASRTGDITPIEGGGARKTPIPVGEKKLASDLRASEQKILNIRKLYSPAFVGPITGRAFNVKAKLPEGIRGKIDPKQARFVASNTVLKNEVIKFITGAQMGEKEAERILRQVPDTIDPPEVWEAKYDITIQNVQMLKNIMQQQGVWMPDISAPSTGTGKGSPKTTSKSGNKILSITLSPNQ